MRLKKNRTLRDLSKTGLRFTIQAIDFDGAEQGNSQNCPVAHALMRQFPQFRPTVGAFHIWIDQLPIIEGVPNYKVFSAPDKLKRQIQEFDGKGNRFHGEYFLHETTLT